MDTALPIDDPKNFSMEEEDLEQAENWLSCPPAPTSAPTVNCVETTHTKMSASVGEVASSEVEVREEVTADLVAMASLFDE